MFPQDPIPWATNLPELAHEHIPNWGFYKSGTNKSRYSFYNPRHPGSVQVFFTNTANGPTLLPRAGDTQEMCQGQPGAGHRAPEHSRLGIGAAGTCRFDAQGFALWPQASHSISI